MTAAPPAGGSAFTTARQPPSAPGVMTATQPDRTVKDCPLCGATALKPTEDSFDLAEVLGRWEAEAGVRLSAAVWSEYTQPAAPRVTLYRCAECGFAVFEPVLAGTQEFYACVTTSDGSCYTADKWEFRQAIKDLRRHGCCRVLDIGSGSGYFLDLLRQSLPRVEPVGFEFNREMARLVGGKGHKIYGGESPVELLSEEGFVPFDAVCIFQVLEHVTEPVALVEAARRLLKPEGLLVVAVPDNEGPVRHFSKALTELPPHHLSRWRASTFRAGLPRLGFEVVRIAYEPLPAWMWPEYLPVILDHSRFPRAFVAALKKNQRLLRLLNRFGLKSLPGVRGHSVYVLARSVNGG